MNKNLQKGFMTDIFLKKGSILMTNLRLAIENEALFLDLARVSGCLTACH